MLAGFCNFGEDFSILFLVKVTKNGFTAKVLVSCIARDNLSFFWRSTTFFSLIFNDTLTIDDASFEIYNALKFYVLCNFFSDVYRLCKTHCFNIFSFFFHFNIKVPRFANEFQLFYFLNNPTPFYVFCLFSNWVYVVLCVKKDSNFFSSS